MPDLLADGAYEHDEADGATPDDLTAPSPRSSPRVPQWLENLAALSWRVLVVAALIAVLWLVATYLWTVTASIAVAVVVSAVFAPYVLRLREQGRSRTVAAGIVWMAAIFLVGGVLLLLALAFLPVAAELVSRIDAGLAELRSSLADAGTPAWLGTGADDALDEVRSLGGQAVAAILASAASVVTILILAAFLVFFFLRDGDKAWIWTFQTLAAEDREKITTAGDEALGRVAGYLRGTTVLATIIGVSTYVFLWLLGVPLPLSLAVLAFVATYVPYFGSLVATAVILLVTLAAAGPGAALVMLVLVGIRGVLVSYLVRPAIYARTVDIHPALVLIVLPAGLQLGGIAGLFVAVPVTAVVLTVASSAVAILEPQPAPPLPAFVPAWLDRVAQWGWRVLAAIALIAAIVLVLTAVPLVVIPVVLALVLAASLEPLVRGLLRRGWARGRAAAAAVGGGSLIVIAILVLTMTSLVGQAREMGDTVTAGASSMDTSSGGHLGLPTEAVRDGAELGVQAIISIGDALATLGVIVALSVLLTFYLLRDGGHLWDRVVSRAPEASAGELRAAGSRAFDVLGGYMIGTAAISFVGAASQLVIMVVLGLPLALPVFVLSFFLAFIPYIGGFIGTGIAFLIAIAAGSAADVVVMAIWTIVFNIVQGNVVSPIVYGRTVHLHPAIVLLAIPAGAAIAGILGMFIVVPALGVVAVTWRTVLSVIGGEPADQGVAQTLDASPDVAVARSA